MAEQRSLTAAEAGELSEPSDMMRASDYQGRQIARELQRLVGVCTRCGLTRLAVNDAARGVAFRAAGDIATCSCPPAIEASAQADGVA
jgi:hypothetical protein